LASPIARMSELPFVGNITQFGVRNLGAQASLDQVRKIGSNVITARRMREFGPAAAIDRFLPKAKNIYVTIDTDFFDFSCAPGSALPEPGGFTLNEMRECMKVLATKGNIVGFDVVCLNPMLDTAFYGGVDLPLKCHPAAIRVSAAAAFLALTGVIISHMLGVAPNARDDEKLSLSRSPHSNNSDTWPGRQPSAKRRVVR